MCGGGGGHDNSVPLARSDLSVKRGWILPSVRAGVVVVVMFSFFRRNDFFLLSDGRRVCSLGPVRDIAPEIRWGGGGPLVWALGTGEGYEQTKCSMSACCLGFVGAGGGGEVLGW